VGARSRQSTSQPGHLRRMPGSMEWRCAAVYWRVGSRDIFSSAGEHILIFLLNRSDRPVFVTSRRSTSPDLERAGVAHSRFFDNARLGSGRHEAAFAEVPLSMERPESDDARLIAHARCIGDRLETWPQGPKPRLVGSASGTTARMNGPSYRWGPNLYEGNAGIVLFLAYLAAVTRRSISRLGDGGSGQPQAPRP